MRSFLLQQSQKCPYLLGVIRILNSLCYYFIKKKYERFHVNGHTTGLHVHTHLMKKYKSFKFSPLTTMQRLFTGKRKRH